MPSENESIPGELVILDLNQQNLCWPKTVLDLLKLIVKYVAVALKGKPGFQFVVVAKTNPAAEDVFNPWFKVDASGNFISLNLFQQNDWKPVYPLPPYHVMWLVGDPNNPPAGFRPIDGTVSGYPNLSTQFRDVGDGRKLYCAAFVGYTSTTT